MKLYELDDRLEHVLHLHIDRETGELDPACMEELDALEGALEEKVCGTALYIQGLLLEASATRGEEKRLAARRHALERQAESLKKYILDHASQHGTSFRDHRVTVSVGTSKSCHIEDETELPEEFVFMERKVDKKSLLERLKTEDVAGARLVAKQHLRIR